MCALLPGGRRTYGPETDPPMPASLAATFLREGWAERCGEEERPEDFPEVVSESQAATPTEPEPDAACVWCEAKYRRRITGGSVQRFCSTDCRSAFHLAARRWALRQIDEGRLEVGRLREQ